MYGQKSFRELKEILMKAPILALPSESGGYIIYSDASLQGLGCILIQNDYFSMY